MLLMSVHRHGRSRRSGSGGWAASSSSYGRLSSYAWSVILS
jgi:hypothetical protein